MSNASVVNPCIRRNRTRFVSALATLIVTIALIGSPASASNGQTFLCSDRTLEGTYGIQIQGTRTLPPALGGGTEVIIGVVIRTYDGAGNFTQIDNVKGSVTGITPDRPGFGTYQVSGNCTAITYLQPAPGIVVEDRMIIMHGGSEVRAMTLRPAGTMVTAVSKRIDRR